MKNGKFPRVAIVHDWLVGGGAERVVEQLHKLYPDAPIYASYATKDWRQKLNSKVVTGYLQRWPFLKLRKFIPFLRGWWFSRLNFTGYDLVISSSGAEAKFIKIKSPTLHVAYIHAPTHYYWDRYDDYLKHPGFGPFNWLARIGLKLLVGPMRRWDYCAAQRPDYLIANSTYTKEMIKKYYHRDSAVIHPPVDVERFSLSAIHSPLSTKRTGFVCAGRQTPYKRIDLAVAACSKLNLLLNVIGDGPEHNNLVKMAGPTIKFITNAKDPDMPEFFQQAEAFIFPGLDDFGIVAVEAMAAGTPVIAFKGGGALDYITEGKTGLFFDKPTADSLIEALQKFNSQKFDSKTIRKAAEAFSPKKFRDNLNLLVKSLQ